MDKILETFIILRILSLIIVQTWFVPDETWQVTEVAHHWIFGYGYLCWEWKEAIRSILYPGIISFVYCILSILKIDYVSLLIHVPRVLSSLFFATGDYYSYKLSEKLFGRASSGWVAVCLSTSWFLAYCAPRTLSSCAEMTLFAIALYNYPWHQEKGSVTTKYLTWGGAGCIIRPTLAVFLLPYCIRHLIFCQRKMRLLLHYCFNVLFILLISVGIDSVFYGGITIVPLNFLKFNFFSGLSSHYGTYSWHWYFTQGLPVTCGLHFIPLVFGIIKNFKKYRNIFLPSLWGIIVHSFLAHKEFRFLLPIIPLLLAIAGDSIFVFLKNITNKKNDRNRRNLVVLCILIIPNVIALVYMGLIHQRGPLDVMNALRTSLQSEPNANFLFLTPCHSTPLYSHLHSNISLRFLTCEPNLFNKGDYKDEADIFYEAPMAWLQKELLSETEQLLHLPTHIIMFDTLATSLQPFLDENHYSLCERVFNAHFYDGNRGNYFYVYCHSL